MAVYLIGVRHRRYQYQGLEEWQEFLTFLKQICKEKNIDLIAEELNEEAIRRQYATDSVARLTAREIGIKHIFCDPDSKEREKIGIKSKKDIGKELGYSEGWTREQMQNIEIISRKDFPARERFWIERLCEYKFNRSIFILGAKHIDTFSKLLSENKIEVEIIARDLDIV